MFGNKEVSIVFGMSMMVVWWCVGMCIGVLDLLLFCVVGVSVM